MSSTTPVVGADWVLCPPAVTLTGHWLNGLFHSTQNLIQSSTFHNFESLCQTRLSPWSPFKRPEWLMTEVVERKRCWLDVIRGVVMISVRVLFSEPNVTFYIDWNYGCQLTVVMSWDHLFIYFNRSIHLAAWPPLAGYSFTRRPLISGTFQKPRVAAERKYRVTMTEKAARFLFILFFYDHCAQLFVFVWFHSITINTSTIKTRFPLEKQWTVTAPSVSEGPGWYAWVSQSQRETWQLCITIIQLFKI